MANLAAGSFPAVEGKLDPKVKSVLTLPALHEAWTGYQHLLGSYRSHGAATYVRHGQLDDELVPVTMANKQGVVSITFNPNGTIAGLFFGRSPGST